MCFGFIALEGSADCGLLADCRLLAHSLGLKKYKRQSAGQESAPESTFCKEQAFSLEKSERPEKAM